MTAARKEARAIEASVIIVTHDSLGDIEPCLEALGRMERSPAFEVVVVDNGSKDGTPELVERRFPHVRVVRQANRGFGAGNNRGAKEGRGGVLVFLNPDTVPEPGFLAELVAAVGPRRWATAQLVLLADPGRVNTWGNRLHFTGYSFVNGYRGPRLPPGQPVAVPGLSGAAFAVRRRDYEELGGFDEDFFLYMEDTELSWRLRRAGMEVVLVPGAVATHDYELHVSPGKVFHLETGRTLLLRKHLPHRLALAYFPSLVLAELMAWGWSLALGWPGLAAKARSVRAGWRRGIRRWPLPRTRPHRFADRRVPISILSDNLVVRVLGGLANGVFRINTALWPRRRGEGPDPRRAQKR